jgi:hypothetical protein
MSIGLIGGGAERVRKGDGAEFAESAEDEGKSGAPRKTIRGANNAPEKAGPTMASGKMASGAT